MGPNRLRLLQPRLLLAGLLMLVGFGAYSAGAAAQDEPTTLTTSVLLCLEPGCTEDLALTEPADGVMLEVTDTAIGDVLGSCTTGDLESGSCATEIPAVESVTITLDASTLPEGYTPTENPGVLNLADSVEYSFLLFPADGFPDDGDDVATPEAPAEDTGDDQVSELPSTGLQAGTPVSELPETGMQASTPVSELPVTGMQAPSTPADDGVAELPSTGSGSGGDSTGIVVTASVFAAAALGLVAFGARRMTSRNRA